MMPMPSIESTADMEAGSEGSGKKPKTLPCRYCQKRFRRLEHVQRHERTHTKEKPFRCSCGKTFGRRDLLVRHEKLVHFNESNKDPNHIPNNLMPPTQSSFQTNSVRTNSVYTAPPPRYTAPTPSYTAPPPNLIDPDLLHGGSYTNHMSNQMGTMPGKSPDEMIHRRAPGCSLDLLSDAANHLASSGQHMASLMPEMAQDPRGGMGMNGQQPTHFDNRMNEDAAMRNSGFPTIGPAGTLEDYNVFLDDFGLSSHYFLPAVDADLTPAFWSRPPISNQNSSSHLEHHQQQIQDGQEEPNSFSRFGSRLPSLQPEFRASSESQPKFPEDIMRTGPAWKVSPQDHRIIRSKLDDFVNVLPKGFTLPSRHTLSRFLEGYINGFHEHLPFLHVPTISAVNCAPELILALAAVGAQYRFEGHRGNGLWYASRAIAIEQVRRRNSQQVLEILTPPSTYRSDSAGLSPVSTIRHGDLNSHRDTGNPSTNESERDPDENCTNTLQAQLETIQALLVLMAMGTWGPRALLREGLCLQSQIALLVRELGLHNTHSPPEDVSWEDWVQIEGEKRTKFIAFCFFNLQCIAYDMPPLILISEVMMTLPCSAKEWKAENSRQWREARRSTPYLDVTFHEALGRLFFKGAPQTNIPPISSMGNYVLIHALVQQIFFVRQTTTTGNPGTANNSLRSEDIDELSQALRSWQAGWERTPESSLDPSNPNGPVAFNSTALLRLAYIRLHSDLGPCRRLDTRDPIRIAAAFKNSPPLVRSPRLGRAVLQSAYALSIPVRIGIAFVARTQTFSWSIQHSLCNLECAFLLSKWLETIAVSPMNLSDDERNLLEMVRSMLDETEFAVSFTGQDGMTAVDEGTKIKQLGAAVVRLWAETFKGTHIFDIVKLIGSSMEIYAQLLEKGDDGNG